MITLQDFAPQGAVYDGLLHALQQGTMAHATLITGPSGTGKRTLARALTQAMLCTEGGVLPCGRCKACVQAEREEHPDVVTLELGKPIGDETKTAKTAIPVSEIRALLDILSTAPYMANKRIARIWQAEKMNPAAQNALLKTLEEPPEQVFFLLTTENPSLLLPTIVSRCREVRLHGWPEQTLRQALTEVGAAEEHVAESIRLADGSIGRALALAADEKSWALRKEVLESIFGLRRRADIAAVSLQWKNRSGEADALLDTLDDLLHTLLLHRLGRQVDIGAYPAAWQRMAREANVQAFLDVQDAIVHARELHTNNVTWQAVVEQLLLRLMEEKDRWQT